MGMVHVTIRVDQGATGIPTVADRLSPHFGISPAFDLAGQEFVIRTDRWNLVHLPTGKIVFVLRQHDPMNNRIVPVLRSAAQQFARWTEQVADWSRIDPDQFTEESVTVAERDLINAVLKDPNSAHSLLRRWYAPRQQLTPGATPHTPPTRATHQFSRPSPVAPQAAAQPIDPRLHLLSPGASIPPPGPRP